MDTTPSVDDWRQFPLKTHFNESGQINDSMKWKCVTLLPPTSRFKEMRLCFIRHWAYRSVFSPLRGGGPASTKQSRPPLVTHRRHENHQNKNLTTSLLNWIELYKNFKKFAVFSLPLVMQMRHRLFICLHWQTGGRWKWFDFSIWPMRFMSRPHKRVAASHNGTRTWWRQCADDVTLCLLIFIYS